MEPQLGVEEEVLIYWKYNSRGSNNTYDPDEVSNLEDSIA